MAAALLRLRRREDFLRVAASRRRWVTPAFILQARERREPPDGAQSASARVSGSILAGSKLPGSGLEVRVGFTVSRKVGNAVVRNRVRRRLRAAAAEVLPSHAAPGYDLVLVGRAGGLTRPYDRLIQDLHVALGKVGAARADTRT
jgi:ribonuclease P protein component